MPVEPEHLSHYIPVHACMFVVYRKIKTLGREIILTINRRSFCSRCNHKITELELHMWNNYNMTMSGH
jgi:hypothetical protein